MKKGRRFYKRMISSICVVTLIILSIGCSKKDTTENDGDLRVTDSITEETTSKEVETTETATEATSQTTVNDGYITSEVAYNQSENKDDKTEEAGYFIESETILNEYIQEVEVGQEELEEFLINDLEKASIDSVSTFSIDVDTASYSVVRSYLKDGFLPDAQDVRIEELINYFEYDYATPDDESDVPFEIVTELGPCPWNNEYLIASIGLSGKDIDLENRPRTNLVFLLDVSGSMADEDKLPLLQESFKMLVNELNEDDRVSIVVYAGNSGALLEGAHGDQKTKILNIIEDLEAGGSTNGSEGIQLAYDLAKEYFIKNGNNRVILATDGDFNVGLTDQDELLDLIEEKREEGIFLSTLGFGQGNRNLETMELLADNGNGQFAFIDSEKEARKVLVEQLGGTLYTIAKDVKVQVEFNPWVVDQYALIGYDNRMLEDDEFDDDEIDAGEIGAGHQVTALYMIKLRQDQQNLDLRYQEEERTDIDLRTDELMYVKLRYKEPKEDESQLIDHIVMNKMEKTSNDFGFAVSVAEFGLALRGDFEYSSRQYEQLYEQTMQYVIDSPDQYKIEFVNLIELAGFLNQ